MSYGFKWRAQSTIYRDSVDLLGILDPYGDAYAVALPVNFEIKKQERHLSIAQPTIELSPDSARSLMQALWDAGIRPADFATQHGELTALKKHIEFAEHVSRTLLVK